MPAPNTYEYTPICSVPQAIEAMTAIAGRFPPTDGIAAFNRMYLQVTQAVAHAIGLGVFSNSDFLDHLDVVFANYYLSAIGHAEIGADVPRCWDVLWRRRSAGGRGAIQFAVAGMNAHINHDLVLALVATFTDLSINPHDPQIRADFDRVNILLATLDRDIRRSYEHGILLGVDRHFGRVEDCVDRWSITRARTAAWEDALTLWKVRDHATVRREYESLLDHATALVGRCMLLPLAERNHHDHSPCATQKPLLPPFKAQDSGALHQGSSNSW